MAYVGTLKGWNELVALFLKENYILEYGLDNIPYWSKTDDTDDDEPLDYESLPDNLREALDEFEKQNDLNKDY